MNKAFTIALLTLALVCSAGFGNTPKWVLFHPSGEVEVRDDQMPESDVAVRQRQLPLYTKRPDGTLSPGAVLFVLEEHAPARPPNPPESPQPTLHVGVHSDMPNRPQICGSAS
jgi:hypothetical protein